jgi:hypothetical protein
VDILLRGTERRACKWELPTHLKNEGRKRRSKPENEETKQKQHPKREYDRTTSKALSFSPHERHLETRRNIESEENWKGGLLAHQKKRDEHQDEQKQTSSESPWDAHQQQHSKRNQLRKAGAEAIPAEGTKQQME